MTLLVHFNLKIKRLRFLLTRVKKSKYNYNNRRRKKVVTETMFQLLRCKAEAHSHRAVIVTYVNAININNQCIDTFVPYLFMFSAYMKCQYTKQANQTRCT